MTDKSISLSFYGAAGTVTGSKHLLKVRGRQILLDAGLFQGLKNLRLRNWQKPPFNPYQIDAVVLSHAHIDHSGYLPILVRERFRGSIYCAPGTEDLLNILLPDTAHLQEEEAEFANRHGFSKHKPALPLFTLEDVRTALEQVKSKPYNKLFSVTEAVSCKFHHSGHILGSSIVELEIKTDKHSLHRLIFSGDLGRWAHPILKDPSFVPEADTLLIESTYGNKIHPHDHEEQLARAINEAVQRGGVIVIPAFAVGRTQELLWLIRKLEDQKKIPSLRVYIDSPMAIDATEIYSKHPEDHDFEMTELINQNRNPLASHNLHIVKTPQESKKLNDVKNNAVIISASGMASGGRVVHHLSQRLPDPKNTILLSGFQAMGTRGRALQDGAKSLRMFGQQVPVLAKIEKIDGLSAHADKEDIMKWLQAFKRPPKQTFIIHGEPEASKALAENIRTNLKWTVHVAEDGQTVTL